MRIIIIDDHKIFGEGLASLLSSIDLEVVRVFQEPKIALEYLDKVNDVDVVFTDINMPELNGFKICEAINNCTENKYFRMTINTLDSYNEKNLPKN